MIIGAKDRSDYRTYSVKGLIEEAKYYPSVELCIALAERLEQTHHDLVGEFYDRVADEEGY